MTTCAITRVDRGSRAYVARLLISGVRDRNASLRGVLGFIMAPPNARGVHEATRVGLAARMERRTGW